MPQARILPLDRECDVFDILFIAAGFAFFVLCAGYVRLCARL
jgi:hypothetical protein